MVLSKVKKKISKSISSLRGKNDMQIKSSKWMRTLAEEYYDNMARDMEKDIIADVERIRALPQITRAIECAMNKLSNEGNYTFDSMLVIKNPYQYSPLCAMALFTTSMPYSVSVTVKGKTEDTDIKYTVPKKKKHRVPIMGLYPDYENTIIMELINAKGKTVKQLQFLLTPDKIKGKSKDITVTKEISKAKYVYDLTLVYGGDDGIFPYAFDRNGDIRFCFSMVPKTYGFQPISEGKFLFLSKKITRMTCSNAASLQLFEVDQMGRFHKLYNVAKGTHHDFAESSKKNIIAAGNAFEGNTYEDTVVEIDRKTGEVLKEIRIKDYIDSKYIQSGDWAHLNSVELNEEEKTITVSLRNLHTVAKINYEKKEVIWILGHPSFWKGSSVEDKVLKPVGDNMKWFFQQHAAYFIEHNLDGNENTKQLIVYDNHTSKRTPVDYYDNEENSFVLIYSIDEKEKTVRLFKSYESELSNIRSNAVYEHDKGRVLSMGGKLRNNKDNRKGLITEFDYDTGEVLNQYSVNNGFYRAYGFKLETEKMSLSMEEDNNYSLGNICKMVPCEKIDLSKALELPEPVLTEGDTTEEERSARIKNALKENPDYVVNPVQDIARIALSIEDDLLCVKFIDHLLEGIYLVGEEHTYFRDYSGSTQERPEYFARMLINDPIPLMDLEYDTYEVYYKHSSGLYKSGNIIKITEK